MTARRQSKISATLRLVAGECGVLWLVGPLLCSAERISERGSHDEACAGAAGSGHHDDIVNAHEHEQPHGLADAHHHDDSETQHEHSSKDKKPCDEKICCSTMQAFLPTAKPIIIANPLSQQLFVVCLLNAPGEQTLAASNCESVRQAKPRDRGFSQWCALARHTGSSLLLPCGRLSRHSARVRSRLSLFRVPVSPCRCHAPNNVTAKIQVQSQQPRKKHDHERIEINDQRPHLRNDRGRSHRAPRRTRWKDVLVSVRACRCQAGGQVWLLLWVTTARAHQP